MSDARVDATIVREQRAWRSPESIAFYRHHRQRPDDLYPSERFFLPDTVRKVNSMLDVGCAAGGFSAVARAFNPAVRYVGVDIVPAFIEAARIDHPDAEFIVGDGMHFETPPGSFELAHASGVLHLTTHFREIVRAMWAQTSRYLLCDLRLTRARGEVGRMESPFGERQSVSLPYVVLTVDVALDMFRDLDPTPCAIRAKGYPHRASAASSLSNPDVLMAFFLIEKGSLSKEPLVDVQLDPG
jgi:SAM-dependent methyltransferase